MHFPVFWACGCNPPASDIACNCCNDSCNCCNLPGASGAFCIHMPKKKRPCLCRIRESRGMAASQQDLHRGRYQVTASRYREERQQRQQRIQTRRSHHITSCHTMLHSLVMLNCGFSCCLVQDGELHALLSCCKTIIICLRAMETPGDAASLVTRKI